MHRDLITEKQLKHLAWLVRETRRNAGGSEWELPGIEAQLAKLTHLPLHQVATAAVWAATRLDQRTPAIIPAQGSHWRELPGYAPPAGPVTCPYHRQHPKPCPECAKHAQALPDPETTSRLAAEARRAARKEPPCTSTT